MKKYRIVFFLLLLCNTYTIDCKAYLTFKHHHISRMGDALLNFAKHYLMAKKYNLDLVLLPHFPYINQFRLHDILNSREEIENLVRQTTLKHFNQLNTKKDRVLYVGNYYLPFNFFGKTSHRLDCHNDIFKYCIENPDIKNEFELFFTPKKNFETAIPKDIPTVALHIRKGSGTDSPLYSKRYRNEHPKKERIILHHAIDFLYPIKFPPEQYYAEQLLFLYELLNYKQLYVYLFTDDKDPESIKKRLDEYIKNPSLIIECYKNKSEDRELEDMVAISQCSHLIRSGSHYAWAASMLGNHKIIIMPTAYEWHDDYLAMKNIQVQIPNLAHQTLHSFEATYSNLEAIQHTLHAGHELFSENL